MLQHFSSYSSRHAITAQCLAVGSLLGGLLLGLPTPSIAAEEIVPPTTISGESGGDIYKPACGFRSEEANYTFELEEATSDLSIVLSSALPTADMTLIVEGPDGRICVDDTDSSLMPSYDGPWPAGDYSIWVGDWGDSQPFELTLE